MPCISSSLSPSLLSLPRSHWWIREIVDTTKNGLCSLSHFFQTAESYGYAEFGHSLWETELTETLLSRSGACLPGDRVAIRVYMGAVQLRVIENFGCSSLFMRWKRFLWSGLENGDVRLSMWSSFTSSSGTFFIGFWGPFSPAFGMFQVASSYLVGS